MKYVTCDYKSMESLRSTGRKLRNIHFPDH